MIRGPWYITVRAVRDYLALTHQPDDTDGPIFDAAAKLLSEIAEHTVASGRMPRPDNESGALTYRASRRYGRIRLIVQPAPRIEGDRPQLVAVRRG